MSEQDLRTCIDHCTSCHQECLQTAMGFCLDQGGKHADPAHLRMMLACAEICQTTANVMLIGHGTHREICRACADACEQCAQDCENIGDMESCVEACQQCATSCRAMSEQ